MVFTLFSSKAYLGNVKVTFINDFLLLDYSLWSLGQLIKSGKLKELVFNL